MSGQEENRDPEINPYVRKYALSWSDRNRLTALNRLMTQCLENSGRVHQPITESDFYDITNHQEKSVIPYVIVDSSIVENAGLIGTATVVRTRLMNGWVVKIEDVVVDERFRGQRYGRALMKFIFETLQHWSSHIYKQPIEVYLKSRPDQKLANAMYENHGFKLIATATNYPESRNVYQKLFTP